MLDDRYPAHRLPEHLFERRRHRCRQQVTPAEQPPASDPHLVHDEILHPRQTISTGPGRSALYAATRPLEYNSYAATTESARPMKTLFLVVGKFVEFHGDGVAAVPVANRATIGNMSPEFGSTCAIFPIDEQTLTYLRLTGRPAEQVALVEAYAKEQGLWHDPSQPARYS